MKKPSPRRAVSSTDVAAHAGVSQATVSRVLSGKDNVSQTTRATVLASLAELGYQPNINARALRTQRTETIAVVVTDITNPFYPELVEALSEELAARGQMMLLWNDASASSDRASSDGAPSDSASSDSAVLAAMMQGLVDGAIFATAIEDSPTLQVAHELELPIVLVNRRVDEATFDSVTSDNAAGGRTVANYFHQHGRRPAVITGPSNASTSRTRAEGFVEEWSRLGETTPPIVRYDDFSHDAGVAFCEEMMSLSSPPDAIFAANDLTAFGVLDKARRMGVSVPDDLWVVGFDDIAMASWATFDLTTVGQPLGEMSSSAVQLLLERIAENDREVTSLRFNSELIIRGSTGSAPISNPAD